MYEFIDLLVMKLRVENAQMTAAEKKEICDGTILETYPAQLAAVYSVYLLNENGEIIPMCGNPE